MNWTEGTLARHARNRQPQGKEILTLQKQHFAKKRAELTVKTSPPTMPFAPSRPPFVSQSSDSSRKRPRAFQTSSREQPETTPFFGALGQVAVQDCDDVQLMVKRRKLLMEGNLAASDLQKKIPIKFSRTSSCKRIWSKSQRSKLESGSRAWAFKKERNHERSTSSRTGSKRFHIEGSSSVSQAHRSALDGGSNWSFIQYSDGLGRPVDSSNGMNSPSRQGPKHGQSNQHHVLSSTPPIYHPVPLRRIPPKLILLRSDMTEDTDSVLAQVGGHLSPFPASQEEDNEAWMGFVSLDATNIDNRAAMAAHQRQALRYSVVISPGISELQQGHAGLPSSPMPVSEEQEPSDDTVCEEALQDCSPQQPVSVVGECGFATTDNISSTLPHSGTDVSEGQGGNSNLARSIYFRQRSNSTPDLHRGSDSSACQAISQMTNEDPTMPVLSSRADTSEVETSLSLKQLNQLAQTATQSDKKEQRKDTTQGESSDDDGDVWRRFVFSGSDDTEELARKALAETFPVQSEGNTNGLPSSTDDLCETGTLVSQQANYGSPSSLVLVPPSLETQEPYKVIPFSEVSGIQVDEDSSDPISMAVEPPMSVVAGPTSPATRVRARFVPPKLFIGKLSSKEPKQDKPLPRATVPKKRKGGRRSKRKAESGRTDIRTLPNYSDDPIEDDDGDEHGDARPGLFRALEVE